MFAKKRTNYYNSDYINCLQNTEKREALTNSIESNLLKIISFLMNFYFFKILLKKLVKIESKYSHIIYIKHQIKSRVLGKSRWFSICSNSISNAAENISVF